MIGVELSPTENWLLETETETLRYFKTALTVSFEDDDCNCSSCMWVSVFVSCMQNVPLLISYCKLAMLNKCRELNDCNKNITNRNMNTRSSKYICDGNYFNRNINSIEVMLCSVLFCSVFCSVMFCTVQTLDNTNYTCTTATGCRQVKIHWNLLQCK